MILFKKSKKSRSKSALFNPYKNGISQYDMAYLSSKKVLKNKSFNLQNDFQKDNLAITNLFDLFVKDETNIEISSSNFFLSSIFAEVETLI